MSSSSQRTPLVRKLAASLFLLYLALASCAPDPDPWVAVGLSDAGIRLAGGVASDEEAALAIASTSRAGRLLSGQVSVWEEAGMVPDFLSLLQADPLPALPLDGQPPRLYLMQGALGWTELAVPSREVFLQKLPQGAVLPESFDAHFRSFQAWEEEQQLPPPLVALVLTEERLEVWGQLRRGKMRDRVLASLAARFPNHTMEDHLEVSDEVRRFPQQIPLPPPPALPEKDPQALVATYLLGQEWKVVASGREAEGSSKRLAAVVGDRLALGSVLLPYHDAVADWEAEQRKPWPWLALAAFGEQATLFGEVRDDASRVEVVKRAEEILDGFAWESKIQVTDKVRHCKDSGASLRTFPRPPRDGRPGSLAATWLGETWKRGDPRLPNSLQGQFPRGFGWEDLIAEFGRLSRPETNETPATGLTAAVPVDAASLVHPWVSFLLEDQTLHLAGEVNDARVGTRLREKLTLNFPNHEIEGEIVVTPYARPVEDYTLTIGTTPRADGGLTGGTARVGFSWQDDAVFVVYFDENTEAVGAVRNRLKKQLEKAMTLYPKVRFDFVGHTDAEGEALANLQLSANRAGDLVNQLLVDGFPLQRLEARGMGETVPDGDNATEEGRQQNRRVQIRIVFDTVTSL